MGLEHFAVQRVRMYVEPNTAYAVDHTGTLGDYSDLPIQGVASFTKPKILHDPMIVQTLVDGRSEKVVGRRGPWSLSFSLNLASTGTAATSGVQAATDVVGSLLKAIMGAENRPTGTTINDAGADADDFDLTATTGWVAGMYAGTVVSSARHWRPVKTLAGSNIILSLALPSAPSNGADVAAATVYTLTEDPDTSLQFIVQSGNSTYVLLGGQGSWSYTIPRQGLGTMQFTISGHYWLNGAEAAMGAAVAAAATMPTEGYALCESGGFFQWTNGTTTYTASDPYTTEGSQVHVSDETWNFTVPWIDVPSPSGVQGILRKRRGKAELSGSFRCPYQSELWDTARTSALNKAFMRVIGDGTAGSTIILHAPTAQVEDTEPVEVDGMWYQDVTWTGRKDAETTASGRVQDSLFRHVRA